ncbi:MAG TPA: MFS transporter [Elusimicrobiales bacterium]|nr:MFS transporter [Elusimicrobiales bacterium]
MQRRRVKNSVTASIKDGVAWALMSGFADPYGVPFALALGAAPMGIGLLRSLPPLASSFCQLFSEKLVLVLGRCKRALLLAVGLQAASLFAAAAVIFLPLRLALPFFIALTVVYTVAGNMAAPPWAVMMGEYIPPSRRGNFFGFRSRLLGIVFFAASFAAARILGLWEQGVLWGFFLVFAAAGLFRVVSFYYLTLMYEPRNSYHLPRGAGVDFISSFDLRRGRIPALFFSVFVLLFATYLSAPFFGVYALEDLRCSYPRYMVLMSVGPLLTYLFMRRWGAVADRYGSVKVLKAAFVLIPAVPLLWTLSRNFYYLAAVEICSGVIWGAFLIGMNNFIYEAAPAHSRTGYNAFYGFISGIAQSGGALLGGWLYGRLPAAPGSAFIPLLLLSAVIRALALIPLFALVKDTRGAAGGTPADLLAGIAGFGR